VVNGRVVLVGEGRKSLGNEGGDIRSSSRDATKGRLNRSETEEFVVP